MYELRITTGGMGRAGTIANVFVQLIGAKGRSPQIRLNDRIRGNAFMAGRTDVARLEDVPNLGILTGLLVGHDNRGLAPGWFLNEIVVRHVETNQAWTFPCYQWLAESEGDRLRFRPLNPHRFPPRRFFIIAHMCNRLDDVGRALDRGANSWLDSDPATSDSPRPLEASVETRRQRSMILGRIPVINPDPETSSGGYSYDGWLLGLPPEKRRMGPPDAEKEQDRPDWAPSLARPHHGHPLERVTWVSQPAPIP